MDRIVYRVFRFDTCEQVFEGTLSDARRAYGMEGDIHYRALPLWRAEKMADEGFPPEGEKIRDMLLYAGVAVNRPKTTRLVNPR